MNLKLLQKLKSWRSDVALKEGVELFRVLPNRVIEEIAEVEPKTGEELMSIKGIKEKKFGKYGVGILSLVNDEVGEDAGKEVEEKIVNVDVADGGKELYTVSRYLNFLNVRLSENTARIQGEISSLDIRGSYLFFSLKDKEDDSLLNCFMWKNNYDMCGVSAEEGMEVIVEGYSEIYKPSGRLSLKASTMELVGEGALKRAYEELKRRLEEEGLFAVERKKLIPEFPKKIGLITSETGAVIHDFLNNLGQHGYEIKFVNSRVEGQNAIRNLLSSVNYFNNKDIDVLVIIRGGGSLESLQAFNNEALVRKVSELNIPVICGIGHDKDVSLVSLAADKAVSTPTAVTKILDETWDKALSNLTLFERDMLHKYQGVLENTKNYIEESSNRLSKQLSILFQKFEKLEHRLERAVASIGYSIENAKRVLVVSSDSLLENFKAWLEKSNSILDNAEKQLKIFDPARQLKLGYGIISSMGKVIKSVGQVKVGEDIDARVSDGKIISKVKKISN